MPGGPSISGERVVVVGAGALGCAVLPRLARMRIGSLVIVDGDRVEAANLGRQPLYEDMDIGFPKATTAAGWMRQIIATGTADGVDAFVDDGNAEHLLRGADLVVEGVDDLHAKHLIDRTCGTLGIPLVSGGVHQHQGQVIVLHATGEGSTLHRNDLFNGRAGAAQDGCDMRQVPIDLLEEVGKVMAARARAILRGEPVTNGAIELWSGSNWISLAPPR